MRSAKKKFAALFLLPLISMVGCGKVQSYSKDYSQARKTIQGVAQNEQSANDIGQKFTSAFNSLGTPEFVDKASSLYADKLYINDTLSQFSTRDTLIEHFKGMNKRVSNADVTLINTTFYNDSAYVHWHMAYDFKMFGKTRSMASSGMSEIKVNADNQIIFQQDFWDPANGLYRSLPLVSGAYSWVLPFKKSP